MATEAFEIDSCNGNKITRNQLRTNPSTGERRLVKVFVPRVGATWETPVRILAPDEKWPPDSTQATKVVAPKPSSSDELRQDILSWLKNGDPEE